MMKKGKENRMQNLMDIFKEGSQARQTFAKYYSVLAILAILTVLVLLALATQGS